ncbi:hypothetical protein BJ166DRAFT_491726 [Pestalotiopsis sp. NC0098]|nr:hypothetical protein BJ166DRAFT_491726 [Pestalotiopsis sp. NC0098]
MSLRHDLRRQIEKASKTWLGIVGFLAFCKYTSSPTKLSNDLTFDDTGSFRWRILASIIRISRHGICYCEHSNRERPDSQNCNRPTPEDSNRQYSRCELSNHEFYFPILRLAPGNTPQYFDVHGLGCARERDLVGSRRQVHT